MPKISSEESDVFHQIRNAFLKVAGGQRRMALCTKYAFPNFKFVR